MRIFLSLIVLALLLPLYAQEEKSRINLPYGDGEGKIGTMKLDQGFWAPPFFVVKADGEIVVADCLHQRLNRYSPAGKWLGSLPCPNLTTRLRFFDWNETSQCYLTMNDQTIAVLDKTGAETARYDFGMNIPDRLWLGATKVFAALTVDGKRFSLAFDYGLSAPRSFTFNAFGRSVPALRDDQNGIHAFIWDDQRLLDHSLLDLPEQAELVKVIGIYSLWSFRTETGQDLWLIGADALQGKTSLKFIKNLPSDCLVSAYSADGRTVYKAYSSEKNMEIVAYRW